MNTKLSILFYIKRAKSNSDGKSPIYLRITVNGRRTEFSVKRTVDPEKWSSIQNKMKGNSEEARTINTYLDILKSRIYEIQKDLIHSGKRVDGEVIKNEILGINEKRRMLIPIFEEHNDRMQSLIGKEYAKGTLSRYNTCLSHVKEFLKWKYNISDIEITDIDHSFIADFEFFLRTQKSCANNSAVKYIKNFGKIIRTCLANRWLVYDPFISYDSKFIEVERGFLDDDEMDRLSSKNFTIERIDQVRDIFLFSCYTGLAYIDTKNLKKSNIGMGIDGNKWIFTSRQKTRTISNIPLLPQAEAIIDKYKNHPYCQVTGSLLPVLSNQKMNAYLKEIADLCGINKKLTFHIARHTFATTITLSNGVPIESVSKMLGHRSIKTTQHYAKILDSKVSNDMNILKEKLSQKELKMKIS